MDWLDSELVEEDAELRVMEAGRLEHCMVIVQRCLLSRRQVFPSSPSCPIVSGLGCCGLYVRGFPPVSNLSSLSPMRLVCPRMFGLDEFSGCLVSLTNFWFDSGCCFCLVARQYIGSRVTSAGKAGSLLSDSERNVHFSMYSCRSLSSFHFTAVTLYSYTYQG